jgi:hypothetical protein
MSLTRRGDHWHYSLYWNGRRYRGSCRTSKIAEAKKIESLLLARLHEDGRLPGSKKVPTLSEFSGQFFSWLNLLPGDRPPKQSTRKYYHSGWKLLQRTCIAGLRLDRITSDDVAALVVGSSPANTNNALRTLRRMLKKAHDWGLLSSLPVVKLVEEHGREELLETWMEARLLSITEIARTPTNKHAPKSINYGWQPLRDVLIIMLDTGMRPAEVFRMRWEHVNWERDLIFVPRSKSRKSRRFVGLTKRAKLALLARRRDATVGWIFSSIRSQSGHVELCKNNLKWLNNWRDYLNRLCFTVLDIGSRPMQWKAQATLWRLWTPWVTKRWIPPDSIIIRV